MIPALIFYILILLLVFSGYTIDKLRTKIAEQRIELTAEKNRAVEKLRQELEVIAIQEIETYQQWQIAQHEIEALELDYLNLAAEVQDDD